MKIVIAGAGDVGFHLAKLLSNEQQDITIIERSEDMLDYAQTHLDVMTVLGDSTSVKILRNAEVYDADLFLAMTTSENDNIVTSILAKKMGAKKVVARVSNPEYLSSEQAQLFNQLGIDKIISPVEYASREVVGLVELCEVTDNFDFENGAATLIGVKLDDSSSLVGRTIDEIQTTSVLFSPVAILRGDTTILPRGGTLLHRNDHLYFLTNKKDVGGILKMIGKQLHKINKIMIIGGSNLAIRTALLLENKYKVTIVSDDPLALKKMADTLHNSLILKGNPSNVEMLKEEGLKEMDAFVALTNNSETNIITSLMAEGVGVFKTIALVNNVDYTHISQDIGIDTLINKKLIAANNIFRYVRKGSVEAITSLHGVDAEVIEYVITRESKLTRKNLRKLNFPENAIIGGVIRGNETIKPTGDFQLNLGDKVIVFTMPDAIAKVEQLFR